MRFNKLITPLVTLVLALTAASCDRQSGYLPKPRGYFRIDLPEKAYTKVDTIERYSFECPQYALITLTRIRPTRRTGSTSKCPISKAPST